jgi:bifunctional non-homologous end joining protein LigD
MKSWAIPKDPSFDPHDKRMAVHVEDHPLSRAGFEGEIPTGQYGAGRVMLWDKVYWAPQGDPRQAYADGQLKFTLHSHKLWGHWALVRMKGADAKPAWLLITGKNAEARPASAFSVVDEKPDSVKGLHGVPVPPKSPNSSYSPDSPTAARARAGRPAAGARGRPGGRQ